ncbi:MAG: integration host factor, actinobacterial type [Eggerthellales bacterium]|nr:integration host factor, actinobacterial type [Eggerthellales bacterium]
MALPTMTPEQRAAALEKAAAARKARAELKANIKAGTVTIAEVLESQDEIVKKTKVAAVLAALPGYGKARVAKLMEECGIQESRRVGGLGANQKAALLEKLA